MSSSGRTRYSNAVWPSRSNTSQSINRRCRWSESSDSRECYSCAGFRRCRWFGCLPGSRIRQASALTLWSFPSRWNSSWLSGGGGCSFAPDRTSCPPGRPLVGRVRRPREKSSCRLVWRLSISVLGSQPWGWSSPSFCVRICRQVKWLNLSCSESQLSRTF